MGLFSGGSDRPGPGVQKDEPRKKGLLRFFEIIAREYRDLMKINILFFLSVLPATVIFFLGLSGTIQFAAMLSIIAAYPVGGAAAASLFCITRMLRDDPGFVWEDFKRKFRENLRQASIAGVVATTLLLTQIFFFWVPVLADWEIASIPLIFVLLLLFLLFMMIIPYVFLHYAYINLRTFTIIKNSTLIALSNIGRSFMGAITGLIPWAALFFFFPLSLIFFPLIPLIVFALSWLLSLMWVWPVFDKKFSIEETLNKEREEKEKQ